MLKVNSLFEGKFWIVVRQDIWSTWKYRKFVCSTPLSAVFVSIQVVLMVVLLLLLHNFHVP